MTVEKILDIASAINFADAIFHHFISRFHHIPTFFTNFAATKQHYKSFEL